MSHQESELVGATLVDTKQLSRFEEFETACRLASRTRAEMVNIAVNEYLSNHPVPLNPPKDLGHPQYGR